MDNFENNGAIRDGQQDTAPAEQETGITFEADLLVLPEDLGALVLQRAINLATREGGPAFYIPEASE